MHHVNFLLKGLSFPTINQSPTTLRAFGGRGFHPYGILNNLIIAIVGKMVAINVEVVDGQLDYNLFLGRSWSYAMLVVVLLLFEMIQFPYKGKFINVDQFPYYSLDPNSTGSISFVGKRISPYENIGLGLLKDSSLVGTFAMPPLNFPSNFVVVNMITLRTIQSPDPWIVP